MKVLRYIVGGFFWLEGIVQLIWSFSPPNQLFRFISAVAFLVIGYAIFPIKPTLPSYDRNEDAKTKP